MNSIVKNELDYGIEMQMFVDAIEGDDIDQKILKENREEMKSLNADVLSLSELFKDFGMMVEEQGSHLDHTFENLEIIEENIDLGSDDLEKSAISHQGHFKKFFNLGAVAAGGAIGSIGWFGGPWIGIPTTLLGFGIGGTIVFIKKKFVG